MGFQISDFRFPIEKSVIAILTVVLVGAGFAYAAGVGDLRCEYRRDPLGMDEMKPRLSWKLMSDKRGERQTAYRVLVSSSKNKLAKDKGDLWDTGKVKSDRSIHVEYEGKRLASRMECFWKVMVWDKDGDASKWSAPGHWEMGLLNKDDWKASWISRERDEQDLKDPRRSFLVRDEFDLPAAVRKARVYVTGLGFYELHINGQRVGEDIFTPGWTQYWKRLQYQVYDVTKLFNKGPNAIGAMLGNGWWGGLGGRRGKRYAKHTENLRLLVQLEVTCADGSRHIIPSVSSWKTHVSPVVENTIYHGTTWDARLEQPGWDRPGFEDKDWTPAIEVEGPDVILWAQKEPSIRVTEILKPVKITELDSGAYVLDFGQNHPGRPLMRVTAPAGTEITFRHAEVLNPDGTLYTDNLRSAKCTDKYICKGGAEETFESRFTYRGFRYMEVTGLPAKPDKDTIVSQVLHSAPDYAGKFKCSNKLVNRIWLNTMWGQRSNMHSVLTDCPQRDERLGWLGDAQAFAPTACLNMDMARFLGKWMFDMQDSQQPDGSIPGVCPTVGDGVIGPGRSGWADAITIVPWVVYQYYGDTRILESHYDANKRWIDYMQTKVNSNGLYHVKTWGDWVSLVRTDPYTIASAYCIHSTRLFAKMAAILGKEKDAEKYDTLADKMTESYNSVHLKDDGNYCGGTQAANLIPLAFGIAPEDRREQVFKNVADDVVERGGHHSTGFLGTPIILPMLEKFGSSDLAWQIISSEEYPSLGYMVRNGATTIWELWNADKKGPKMNSRNHFAHGSMCQWLYEGVGGIKLDPENPGFKHFILSPCVVGDLTFAKTEYESVYGTIRSYWKNDRKKFKWDVTVPPNTTATVYVPAKDVEDVREGGKVVKDVEGIKFLRMEGDSVVFSVGAGDYRFESKL